MAQLKEFYQKKVMPALSKELGIANPMRVPKITKVVLNMGLGEAVADKKVLENAAGDLGLISGQKPVVTKARKSIAGFKIREGWPIGCKVTLRGERMYEFLERLVDIAIPRIRDFRGLSPKSFDGRGNFSMGVSEQIIFPEIDYDRIDALRGLDVAIATTARSDDEGRALLTALRFPLRGTSPSAGVEEKAEPKRKAKDGGAKAPGKDAGKGKPETARGAAGDGTGKDAGSGAKKVKAAKPEAKAGPAPKEKDAKDGEKSGSAAKKKDAAGGPEDAAKPSAKAKAAGGEAEPKRTKPESKAASEGGPSDGGETE